MLAHATTRNPSAVDNVLFAGIDVPAVRTAHRYLHRGAPLANSELGGRLPCVSLMRLLKLSNLPSSLTLPNIPKDALHHKRARSSRLQTDDACSIPPPRIPLRAPALDSVPRTVSLGRNTSGPSPRYQVGNIFGDLQIWGAVDFRGRCHTMYYTKASEKPPVINGQ